MMAIRHGQTNRRYNRRNIRVLMAVRQYRYFGLSLWPQASPVTCQLFGKFFLLNYCDLVLLINAGDSAAGQTTDSKMEEDEDEDKAARWAELMKHCK